MKFIYVLLLVKIIECTKLTDFCHQISIDDSLINCHDKYSVKCGHDLCAVNTQVCQKLIIFSLMTISKEGINKNKFKIFKSKITNCTRVEPLKYNWNPNHVCLNTDYCVKPSARKQLLVVNKCKCTGRFSYNCNNGYCVSDKRACKGLKTKPLSTVKKCKH